MLNLLRRAISSDDVVDVIPEIPGVINAHEVYTLQEFQLRMGLTDRQLKHIERYIKVVTIGDRQFVSGAYFIAYMTKLVESQDKQRQQRG